MKRKWWIGLGVLVALLGLGAFVVLTDRPQYGFLRGAKNVPMAKADATMLLSGGFNATVYTLNVDWSAFAPSVEQELSEQGFEKSKTSAEGQDDYYWPSEAVFLKQPKAPSRAVSVMKDFRYTTSKGIFAMVSGRHDKGWVTIFVGERGEPSPWGKFMRWLGL